MSADTHGQEDRHVYHPPSARVSWDLPAFVAAPAATPDVASAPSPSHYDKGLPPPAYRAVEMPSTTRDEQPPRPDLSRPRVFQPGSRYFFHGVRGMAKAVGIDLSAERTLVKATVTLIGQSRPSWLLMTDHRVLLKTRRSLSPLLVDIPRGCIEDLCYDRRDAGSVRLTYVSMSQRVAVTFSAFTESPRYADAVSMAADEVRTARLAMALSAGLEQKPASGTDEIVRPWEAGAGL